MATDFATAGQITEIENMIKYILNATSTWGGAVEDLRRLEQAVVKSRIYGTLEVIKAIAGNAQHGFWGVLASEVTVAHNAFLPAYFGVHGLPQIMPAEDWNGEAMTGVEADPDEIDSWRNDNPTVFSLHNRLCGDDAVHNELDGEGLPSVNTGRYSLVNSQLKFTGYECTIPMVVYQESDCATKTPIFALPTIVKLAPLWNLKEGDNLNGIASTLVTAGQNDLDRIANGAVTVSPVSDVMEIQKEL